MDQAVSGAATGSLLPQGWAPGSKTRLMGIVNVTPDSFSDGGLHADTAAALAHGRRLAAEGACCLDVGGESTRPGSRQVDPVAERERVVPVIEALRTALPETPLSADTSKAAVAAAAIAAGARAVNDVRAGEDPDMAGVVADAGVDFVLMHMRGDPATMQDRPRYRDVVDEVEAFLGARLAAALAAGVREERCLLDPGIGFGKTVDHNLALLRSLPRLGARLGRPLVVGVSRKSLIGALIAREVPPAGRDAASHVLHGLLAGCCALLRVHDVVGARDALRVAEALGGEGP